MVVLWAVRDGFRLKPGMTVFGTDENSMSFDSKKMISALVPDNFGPAMPDLDELTEIRVSSSFTSIAGCSHGPQEAPPDRSH
ncbi:hypothetical protein BOW41_06485 [Solemya velum gill symbiont]|uniref:hypothetical protein n=1 Tax=Solemya velum gill symbiont TaxID=2340 RepID=UPI000996FB8E|nr:hypothetical protein [Solemya velum gill symbiont]OOZ54393.1 hypothetical protein BOW41_06485 [Solemya velum gill symbiont]